jgi:hypothetical protein
LKKYLEKCAPAVKEKFLGNKLLQKFQLRSLYESISAPKAFEGTFKEEHPLGDYDPIKEDEVRNPRVARLMKPKDYYTGSSAEARQREEQDRGKERCLNRDPSRDDSPSSFVQYREEEVSAMKGKDSRLAKSQSTKKNPMLSGSETESDEMSADDRKYSGRAHHRSSRHHGRRSHRRHRGEHSDVSMEYDSSTSNRPSYQSRPHHRDGRRSGY